MSGRAISRRADYDDPTSAELSVAGCRASHGKGRRNWRFFTILLARAAPSDDNHRS
jgi:hypothetical protein